MNYIKADTLRSELFFVCFYFFSSLAETESSCCAKKSVPRFAAMHSVNKSSYFIKQTKELKYQVLVALIWRQSSPFSKILQYRLHSSFITCIGQQFDLDLLFLNSSILTWKTIKSNWKDEKLHKFVSPYISVANLDHQNPNKQFPRPLTCDSIIL